MGEQQRRKYFLAAGALATALLATLIPAQAYGQSVDDEQIVKPEVRVGDNWTYKLIRVWPKTDGSYTTWVTFVGPDLILTTENPKDDTRRAADGSWTSDWNPKTLARGTVYVPYGRWFKFPLKVGAVYESKYELAGNIGQTANAHSPTDSVESIARVIGWEEVVVPAGKFRAIKIEINHKFTRYDTGRERWGKHFIWWAPEIERWIKLTYENADPAMKETHELTAFNLVESQPK